MRSKLGAMGLLGTGYAKYGATKAAFCGDLNPTIIHAVPRGEIIMRIVRYTYPNQRSLAAGAGAISRFPWSGIESEIDRLFDAAVSNFTNVGSDNRFPVDLYEDKDQTYVRAELPGINRDDINVEMVNGYLTITAARKQKEGETEQSYSFSRSVSIPEEVQADKVTATYENGVLTVTLPKREEAKPKKISVAVN
jgi:HSP20 family protein